MTRGKRSMLRGPQGVCPHLIEFVRVDASFVHQPSRIAHLQSITPRPLPDTPHVHGPAAQLHRHVWGVSSEHAAGDGTDSKAFEHDAVDPLARVAESNRPRSLRWYRHGSSRVSGRSLADRAAGTLRFFTFGPMWMLSFLHPTMGRSETGAGDSIALNPGVV